MPKHVRDNSGEGASRKSVARDMLLRFEKIRKQRLVGDVKYWRELAEEKRTEAEFTTQPIRRATLLDTAEGYEVLANRIEQRLGRSS